MEYRYFSDYEAPRADSTELKIENPIMSGGGPASGDIPGIDNDEPA